jgi:hypothetical protein
MRLYAELKANHVIICGNRSPSGSCSEFSTCINSRGGGPHLAIFEIYDQALVLGARFVTFQRVDQSLLSDYEGEVSC